MNEEYFIRSRGRVRGPFHVTVIQDQLRAGTTSRFDQFSADQLDWQPLSKLTTVLEPPVVAEDSIGLNPVEKPLVNTGSEGAPPSVEPIPLAPIAEDYSGEPSSVFETRLGKPAPRVWVGTAVSAGLLIILAVNLPQTAVDGDLLYWWGRGPMWQLSGLVLMMLGFLSAISPLIARHQAAALLAGVGAGILLTLIVSITQATDYTRVVGRLNFNAVSVAERLALFQAAVFATFVLISLILLALSIQIWMRSRRMSYQGDRGE